MICNSRSGPGWTVVKTAPLELLADSAEGRKEMRFLELCRQLGCSGFQLHVYDSSSGTVVVETDGQGTLSLSGYGYDGWDDMMSFHGHPLSEDRSEIRFELLPLQKYLADCRYPNSKYLDADSVAVTLASGLGGRNSRYCDNLTSVDTLISHAPLTAEGGLDLYFEWPARDRPGVAREL